MANGKKNIGVTLQVTDLSNIPQTQHLSHDIKTIYSKTSCSELNEFTDDAHNHNASRP